MHKAIETTAADSPARQLALLGILLQALHVLFGITALIGVLINHVQIEQARGTVYYSQLRWQIVTFWSGLIAYATATWLWMAEGLTWPWTLAVLFCLYRVGCSVWFWASRQGVCRVI